MMNSSISNESAAPKFEATVAPSAVPNVTETQNNETNTVGAPNGISAAHSDFITQQSETRRLTDTTPSSGSPNVATPSAVETSPGFVESPGISDVKAAAILHMDGEIDYNEEINFSFRVTPHWSRLPHFQYRRLMHQFFEHFHVYNSYLPRGSTFAAGVNLAAATIGVGTLSMPYAAYSCGWILFLVLMSATLAMSLWSLYALCRLVDATQLHSFEMLTRTILGSHKLEIVVEVIVIFSCFGSAISYVVVIGDIAESIFDTYKPEWKTSMVRVVAQVVLYVICLQPLSLLKTMGALKYASSVGVCAIAVLVVFILGEGFTFGSPSTVDPVVVGTIRTVLGGIPLLFFAVNNQINALEIYSEMKDRSPGQFLKIACVAVGGISVIFMFVGSCGLMLFGSDVKGNILKNFSASNPLALIALLGVCTKVVLSFPLLMFPCREAVLHFAGIEDVRSAPWKQFVGTTVVIAAACVVIAIFVPTVVTMFGLIGSICAAMFGFILPGALALKEERFWKGLNEDETKRFRIFSWILVVVGVLVGISGTIISVLNLST